MSGNDHGGDRKRDDADAPGVAATRSEGLRKPVAQRKDQAPRKDKASPVGRALRMVYDDMLRETVPDDFLDLLKKLD